MNRRPAGRDAASRLSLKVIFSVDPSTVAEETAAEETTSGVLFATDCQWNAARSLPARSRTRGCPVTGEYRTLTLWPWNTGLARVNVTVRPETRWGPLAKDRSVVPSRTLNESRCGIEVSSRSSLNVTVSVSRFTSALSNLGGVESVLLTTA